MTINEKDSALKQNKKRPTSLTTEFTAAGLKQLPKTWNDVNEKETVLSKAVENVDDLMTKLDRYYELHTQEIGVGRATVTKELVATFYQASDNLQCNAYIKGTPVESFSCGNVIVLYKVEVIPAADAYFADGDGINYEIGMAKNIINTQEGSSSDSVESFELYLELGIDVEKRTEADFVEKIEAKGFTRQ